MGFFRRLKNLFKKAMCSHHQAMFIIKSQRYSQQESQGVKIDFWQDFLVGITCLDCQIELKSTPIILSRYPYAGEPHYPVDGLSGLEIAYWWAKG